MHDPLRFRFLLFFLWGILLPLTAGATPLELEVSVARLAAEPDFRPRLLAPAPRSDPAGLPSTAWAVPALAPAAETAGLSPSVSAARDLKKLDPLLRLAVRRARGGRWPASGLGRAMSLYAADAPRSPAPALRLPLGRFTPSPQAALRAGPAERIGVLITLQGSTVPLRRLGITPGPTRGEVVSARVTPAQLLALSALPEVAYVEASHPLEPELDKSVPSVRADVLHLQDPTALGQGVLLAAVDTGIDWTHLDFRLDRDGDGSEESSRIAFIWDQTEEGPFGDRSGVPYGSVYTREDIEHDLWLGYGFEAGRVRERDENGHGTHVSGILGGDGSSSELGFVGLAPQATLGMVKTTFSSGDIVDGVAFLFERGAELGLPTVVNLSLGGHFGPHDGTSAFERALDALTGPGRIIVNSAGNEGNDNVHVSGTLNRDRYRVDFTAAAEIAVLNFWYEGEAAFTVELDSPGFGEEVTTFRAARGQLLETSWNGSTITIDNASEGPYPFNGDNQLVIVLENIEKDSVWTVTLIHESGPGRFDGWVGLSSLGEFSKGDPQGTISEPGNAPHLITVGAYTSKDRWPSIVGRSYGFVGAAPVGEIATFSSRGPTRDGRQKPDLAAPGTAIVSALAAGSDLAEVLPLVAPDGVHVTLAGTSMAAPHVAGAIALMLQAEPRLTASQALARLRGSARGDAFTGGLPNEIWGFGKLDALEGVDTLGLELPLEAKGIGLKVGLNVASAQAFFFYLLPPDVEEAELLIYDVRGRRVRTLALEPGRTRVAWDLRDAAGRPLANGLYLAVIRTSAGRSPVRALVIRHD